MKKIILIGIAIITVFVTGYWQLVYNQVNVEASQKILSIKVSSNLYDIPAGTTYDWINGRPVMTDDVNFEWANGVPFIIMTATTSAPTLDISNDPSTKAFGIVAPSTTYYAYGSAPSNPVVDGECTFTLTNSGSTCDIDAKIADFTGGVGWNIVSTAPGANEVRITVYTSGINPATGLVLTNADQELLDAFAAGTKKWDFKMETGTFGDGEAKSTTLTLTAVAED